MRRALLIGLLALGMPAATLAPAAASPDPSTTIVIAEGDSVFGRPLQLVAAADGGLVYRPEGSDDLVIVPAGIGATSRTVSWQYDSIAAAGDLVIHSDYEAGLITFEEFDGEATSQAPYDVSTEEMLGATVEGAVVQSFPDDDGYNGGGYSGPSILSGYGGPDYNCFPVVSCGPVRTLTLLTPEGERRGLDLPEDLARSSRSLVGRSGVVVLAPRTATTSVVAFLPVGGDAWLELATVDATTWDTELLDLDGQHLAIRVGSALQLLPLAGGSPVVLPATGVDDYATARLAGGRTWLITCGTTSSVISAPTDGAGDWVALGGPMASALTCSGVRSTSTRVLASTLRGTVTADAGIYALSAPAGPAEKIVGTEVKPLEGSNVALGAGRVVWTDDSTADGPVWQRSLSGSGAGVAAGPKSLVATNATGYGLSVSGRRAIYQANDDTGFGVQTLVVRGGTTTTAPWDYLSGLSGVRYSDEGYRVANVVTGAEILVASTDEDPVSLASLWGDRALAVSEQRGLLVVDTATGTESVVQPPAATWLDQAVIGPDVVAWLAYDERLVDPSCDEEVEGYCPTWSVPVLSYRNHRTGGPVTSIDWSPDSYIAGIHVTSTHVIVALDECTDTCGRGLRAVPIGSATPGALLELPGDIYGLSVEGTNVAWLDEQARVKVTSWAVDAAAPRLVGAGVAPTAFDARPSDAAWQAEWVSSRPLSACSLVVRAPGGAVVSTLDCDSVDGGVLASWNGRTPGGAVVASGTYTWQLTGQGPGGALVGADGGSSGLSGTIVVTGSAAPGAPTSPKATAGVASATVTWVPPAVDGGAPVIDYTVTATPGGAAKTVSGTSVTFAGLKPGTAYTFGITARNSAGSSAAATTPSVVPIAPRPPSLAITTSVPAVALSRPTIAWTASAGTDPIARIEVRTRSGSVSAPLGAYGAATSLPASARSWAPASVAAGTAYCFSFRAVAGSGLASGWQERCTTVVADDKAFRASKGWRSTAKAGAIARAERVSTRQGATLTIPKAVGKGFVLVVGKQRGAGTIGVYVGGKRVGWYSLVAKATKVGQRITVPTGQLNGRSIVVRVEAARSTGVRIDGFAVLK
jgi:hypothetical protein